MSGQEYLVSINVPPLLEEAVVDCLLAIEAAEGFSSFVVNAHSTDHEGLSLAEQVAGRQKKIRFQMYLPEQQLSVLINHLRQYFSGSGIHYWVLPVLERGYI
ncbi:MAG TPA: DUF3240 domain-containing protein [Methyloprofundus sp.]|jgi:hypothetical protein|uniref:DUF3240 family protein n=1 Tax=Methyloprofundus sp. TaxID=2020875 RepID=UPI0017B934D3|nr:DUF3240 family protein [Methyloprofundus sp.]MBT3811858.1 DUF3240 family protein [Gammaproteobacteria bacterium]HIL79171.1 DUF3240 domain-containing protein [Methylococcales bacterium]MBT5223487.1 DUF3240 family protein [Gammaproteobacteria bacterium]MBT5825879.1 DUF3240 family protein [Gammaproteobacteria bacterium]MBT5966364.1 DUF3240 family protein [Gammaproteobacteria bacterium]